VRRTALGRAIGLGRLLERGLDVVRDRGDGRLDVRVGGLLVQRLERRHEILQARLDLGDGVACSLGLVRRCLERLLPLEAEERALGEAGPLEEAVEALGQEQQHQEAGDQQCLAGHREAILGHGHVSRAR
jgi:hypothetical protein